MKHKHTDAVRRAPDPVSDEEFIRLYEKLALGEIHLHVNSTAGICRKMYLRLIADGKLVPKRGKISKRTRGKKCIECSTPSPYERCQLCLVKRDIDEAGNVVPYEDAISQIRRLSKRINDMQKLPYGSLVTAFDVASMKSITGNKVARPASMSDRDISIIAGKPPWLFLELADGSIRPFRCVDCSSATAKQKRNAQHE